ncbi:MAG: hypothetical protein KGS61_13525, partial [Verrucomicrobia bacterium]|nr:hypothetical protein [Verrucomicrobiota bacterium]
ANIYDYRFLDKLGRPLAYVETKNHAWLSRADAGNLRATMRNKPLIKPMARSVSRGRFRLLPVLIIGIVLLAPLPFFLFSRKSANR